MTNVSVIGIGRIGSELVARLTSAGHNVTGFDVNDERRLVLERAGGRWAPDVRSAVSSSDVVFTAVTGSPEILDLATRGQLFALMAPGAIWVDLSSTAPAESRLCAQEADRHAIASLDAPIGGGPAGVRAGQAVVFVGGDPAMVGRVKPILESFAAIVHHIGARGSGHLIKLLINLLWFGNAALVTEAMLVATSAGVTAETFSDVLAGSAGDSTFVQRHLPSLLCGDYLPDFGLDRVVEELDAIDTTAQRRQLPHPITTAVAELHRQALNHYGPVDGELLGAAWLEHLASRRLHDG